MTQKNAGIDYISSNDFSHYDLVLDTAVKAANLIGKGLYGVDLKMVDDKAYVIEINDNPSIDHGLEDAIIGDEMYYRLLNHFEQVLETKHY